MASASSGVSGTSHLIPSDLTPLLAYPGTPWRASPDLFERLQTSKTPVTTPPKPYKVCKVNASDPEYAFIMRYFSQTKPKNYGIKSITCIHNPAHTEMFEGALKTMEAGARNFPAAWRKEELAEQRTRAFKRWEAQAQQFSPVDVPSAKRVDRCILAKVLPLWHGTTHIDSICSAGFTFFGKQHFFDPTAKAGSSASTDIGFFGSGIYFTNSAAYASMYSGNLLLAWVSMREPYPVVSDIPVPTEGADMRRLKGHGAYQNYNAHYIPVTSAYPTDLKNIVYHPCHDNETPAWDEFVVFERAHTLARFHIELGVDFPATPSAPSPATSSSSSSGSSDITVKTFLAKILELMDNSNVQADKEIYPLLSSKADTLIAQDSTSLISSKDKEFYVLLEQLLDAGGKPRSFIRQKLLGISAPSPKQESKAPVKKSVPASSSSSTALSSSSSSVMPTSIATSSESSSPASPSAKVPGKNATNTLTQEQANVLFKKVKAGDETAVTNLRVHAETGSAVAQYYLGDMYSRCRGVVPNNSEALKWYRLAAEQGNVEAQRRLASMYEQGFGGAENTSEALKWYRLAAEQGHAGAQSYLGYKYEKGTSTAQDKNEAMRWYRLAAAQGNVYAQEALERLSVSASSSSSTALSFSSSSAMPTPIAYSSSSSSPVPLPAEAPGKDAATSLTKEQAIALFEKAKTGDTAALSDLRIHAEAGSAPAQYYLGYMYYNAEGVAPNKSEGVRWFRLAAEQEHAHAQCTLGVMYRDGKGVVQDNSEAVRWFRLAAEQGYAMAQYDLGDMYERGKGVAQDTSEAVRWYRLAAEQRYGFAVTSLNRVLRASLREMIGEM